MTPETIAHYRILRSLGSGGMGEVYLAEDTRLGRQVAIKLLPRGGALDPAAKKRLLREAQAVAKLDHPNLCAIHEVGDSPSGSYIVMQFVEGETLSARLKHHRATLEEILDMGLQVAGALSEAHLHGLIHRDIKPANLMITTKGMVKVLDFGLAKDLVNPEEQTRDSWEESKTLLTTPGMVVGTVPYMSPEQVKGDHLDGRSDLFSLGTVLYEMVSGQRPFQAKSGAELMSAILVFEPALLGDDSAPIHPELRRILRKALAKDRQDRYASADDMVADLKRCKETLSRSELDAVTPAMELPAKSRPLKSRPTAAFPDPAATSAHFPVERPQRARPWLLGVLALVLAGAGASGVVWMRKSDTVDSIAVLPFVNASNDPEMDYLSDGLTESLINQLSHLPHLKVIARSSILRYKGKEPDLKAIARELGVKAIVIGRIQSRQGQLTISVELADAAENRHLWGEQMTRPASDILIVQDSLAEEISQNLGRQISPGEHQALAAAKIQTDPEAYQLYLKGRYFADLWTPDNVRKAMAFFDQALARDPKFALAHVGKAYAYWGLSSQFIPSSEAMPKVKSEAEAALLLDPKLAEAHAALAIALADYDRDYVRAEGEFKKAIELNPGSEVAPLWYGYLLLARERPEEALVQLRKALDLDPLSALVESQIGLTYYWGKRDLEKSLSHFERAVQLQPDFYWPHIFKAFLLDRMGKPELAHTSAMKAKEVGGSAIVTGYLGYEAAKLGHREEALRCLHELESQSVSGQGYVGPYAFALIHMGLGDEARTLDWLTKLVDGRDEAALFFAVDPMWDPLRKHKEFQALARKVSQP